MRFCEYNYLTQNDRIVPRPPSMTIRDAFADVHFQDSSYAEHVFVEEGYGDEYVLRELQLTDQVGNWSDYTLIFGPEGLTAEMFENSKYHDELSQSIVGMRQFTLYANTSLRAMCQGYDFLVPMNGTYMEVRERAETFLRNRRELPSGEQMCFLFLPGGMPWLETAEEAPYLATWKTMSRWKPKLYAVFLSKLAGQMQMLETEVDTLCVDNGQIPVRWALSPMANVDEKAYENMACLLTYLRREGEAAAKLFATLANVTHFAPLLVNYNRLMYGQPMRLFNIAVLTASLQCLFRGICSGNYEQATEHSIAICGYLVGKFGQGLGQTVLPIYEKEANGSEDEDVFQKFVREFELEHDIVLWKDDFDLNSPDEPGVGLKALVLELEQIRATSETQFSRVLQDERSLARVRTPAFFVHTVETRKHTCVFVRKENQERHTRVTYFDPHMPELQQLDIVVDDETGLEQDIGNIGRGFIEQDMVLCVDSSKSMAMALNSMVMRKAPGEMSRRDIAKSMVQEFLNMCEGFGVIQYVTMLHFSDKCYEVEGLTKISSIQRIKDALDKVLENLRARTALFDVIRLAVDKLADGTGKKRIVVFSDGDDDDSSQTNPGDLLPILVKAGIVLDVVFLTSGQLDDKLMALVRGTGGAMFIPEVEWKSQECLQRGISFMQQEAFINLDRRRITMSPVSESVEANKQLYENLCDDVSKPQDPVQWDVCDNSDLEEVQRLGLGLTSTEFAKWIRDCETTKRSVRLWREVQELRESQDENSFIRFIYGPGDAYSERPVYAKFYFRILDEDCAYKNRWWCVTAKCQPLYPAMVPVFRFSTIPFHPNVSTEGFVMATLPDVYDPSKSLISQFHAIRELLIRPDTDRTINTRWAMSSDQEREQLLQESLAQALTDDDIAAARPDV